MTKTTSEKTEQIFEATKAKFGFIPNVMTEMAKSSVLLHAYASVQAAMRDGVLTPKQQQAVQLAISERNGCGYCKAAHGAAVAMTGLDSKSVEAIKSAGDPSDPDVAPYVRAARVLVDKRGNLTPSDVISLETDGVDRERLYEIIAIIGAKIMTNWTNHIGHTPLDRQFGGQK